MSTSRIGEWVYLTIPAGIAFPGIIITEPVPATAKTRAGREFQTERAQLITLREANPDGPHAGRVYLQKSPEDLGFTYPRYDAVVGLDADENGVKIPMRDIVAKTMADRLEFSAQQFQNRPAVEALPGLDVEDALALAALAALPDDATAAEADA